MMLVVARRNETCVLCGRQIRVGQTVFVFTATGDERHLYKKVWVHPSCSKVLEGGARPRAVRRFGPTPLQLRAVVKLCEDQLGWQLLPISDPPPTAAELLKVRTSWASKLEALTEPAADRWDAKPEPKAPFLLSNDNLRLMVDYFVRHSQPLRDPLTLVEELRDLQRRDKLHTLPPSTPEWDVDFGRFS